MFIPYATDAPIYHFPKATIAMIVANVGIHIAWSLSAQDAAEPYVMILGSGLHPLQWLTHNFLHAGLLHLVGNMIFLWAYGIIVEGKIGWFLFSLTYLGIGIMHGAAIQIAYMGVSTEQYVLGASGIIFGLMAISMMWAPLNDLSIFYFFIVGYRVISNTIEMPIYVFAILQLGLQGVETFVAHIRQGDPMSSGLLHISGAFWGLVAGIVFVKARWVDCEDFDVFSLMAKRRELRKAWKARETRLDQSKANERLPKSHRPEEDRPSVSPEERAAKLLTKLQRAIELGDRDGSHAAYHKWMEVIGKRVPRDQLLGVITAMHKQGDLAGSVPAMRALCKLYPDRADKIRLKLASILIREQERPTEARRHLERIHVDTLDASLQRLRAKLLQEAAAMIEEGVLEVEEDV